MRLRLCACRGDGGASMRRNRRGCLSPAPERPAGCAGTGEGEGEKFERAPPPGACGVCGYSACARRCAVESACDFLEVEVLAVLKPLAAEAAGDRAALAAIIHCTHAVAVLLLRDPKVCARWSFRRVTVNSCSPASDRVVDLSARLHAAQASLPSTAVARDARHMSLPRSSLHSFISHSPPSPAIAGR